MLILRCIVLHVITDLAGASVGTAYMMTVNLMGSTAATAASVATNTAGASVSMLTSKILRKQRGIGLISAGLLATLAVRVVLGEGAASVVGIASRAAAATTSAAVHTSKSCV